MPAIKRARVDPQIQERVKFYADWLARQAEYDTQKDNSQEINDYIQEASKRVQVRGREVAIFAPFRPRLSALQTFTSRQIVALLLLALLWVVGLLLFHLQMLTVVIAAITLFYTFSLFLNVSVALRTFRNSPEERISDELVAALEQADWPLYTILCPLYREARVVPQFVQAMQALDYPAEKLQVLFLTEEDDSQTRSAIRALALPAHFKIVVVPDGRPRTKPRACNYGLMQAKGPYVVIYDAEDIPDPLQLKKAVLTFANHGTDVVCVQAKLNFYNIRQNLLTRWFTAEYSAWFDVILPGLQLAKFSLPLGGTSNHFRAAALRALGGWDAYNVTEDCDLGLRLKRYRMNTVILDSTTLEEANSQLKNWIRQRSRWIKGYMQTYLVYMRAPLQEVRRGRLYDLFSFQMVIGSGTAVMFINPLMWVLLALYMALGQPVVAVYHLLFPGPILYLGAFCLFFGNFFYIYLYLLACMKRRQYHLLLWTIFIPLYWLLMSVAALYGLSELLVKPHYWQKTVHGLHLTGKPAQPRSAPNAVIEEPTMRIPATLGSLSKSGALPSVTMALKAIPTLLMPAISAQQKQAQLAARRSRVRDLWLVATVVSACLASVLSCGYYFRQHELLLYQDALSHMRIARSVFDSATPGLAQLGSVWLPLPHILMWPFIWNDTLWHSGLAGSLVSMPCYLLTAIYLFLAARRLTRSSSASFVGSLLFILNPNVLYLQTTPLSETVCMATLAMTGYYFVCWTQRGELRQLIIAAACTFLATLARYDGWALFVGLLCLIPLVGVMKRHKALHIEANLVVFGALGGLGIVLWLIWNQLIFGSPLYFQAGLYSSQAQQALELASGKLYSYHNLWQALRFYLIDTGRTTGVAALLLGGVGLVWYVLRQGWRPLTLAALVFVMPLPFYIAALYGGQAIIWVPGANPAGVPVPFYNVRYGAQMVVPVALMLALVAERVGSVSWVRLRRLGWVLLLGVVVGQSVLVSRQGIIALQEGQYNQACGPQKVIVAQLAEHYNGGKVLQDVYAAQFDASDAGIAFGNVIYEGSGRMWQQALGDPGATVEWVVVNPQDSLDLVGQRLKADPGMLAQFTLYARQSNGVLLYHHEGRGPLPSRPAPAQWQGAHPSCARA